MNPGKTYLAVVDLEEAGKFSYDAGAAATDTAIFDFLHPLTRAVVRAIKNNCNFGNSQYAFTTGVFARIFIGRDNGCTSSLSS